MLRGIREQLEWEAQEYVEAYRQKHNITDEGTLEKMRRARYLTLVNELCQLLQEEGQ